MSKTYIPTQVRRDLWILSGAHCEFRGCMNRIDQNFLTKQRVTLGEYCHIIGDQVGGPRGNRQLSQELAKHPDNLILCCSGCHKTIDDGNLENDYPPQLLLEMKREHETHIQRLYDATDVKISIPFLITGPLRGRPTAISIQQARAAVLKKTGYTRFPAANEVVISLNNFPYREDQPSYWEAAKQHADLALQGLSHRIQNREIQYLDIFGLAQIPILAYIGYKLGDCVPATVHQAQRAEPQWEWPQNSRIRHVGFQYEELPTDAVKELAVVISVSGRIQQADVKRAVPGIRICVLDIPDPSPAVVDCEAVQEEFVSVWRKFLSELHKRYGRIKLHVFPALPNSLAVELGRCVFPKVAPETQVWDYYDGNFIPTFVWN